MSININNKLVFNFLVELKKKEIHPVERAEIIKQYLKDEKISVRQLARELNIPHSTIQDWVDYGRLTIGKFNQLIKEGMTKKELHRTLRSERTNKDIEKILGNELNRKLKLSIQLLTFDMDKPDYNSDTLRLIKELEQTLSKLEAKINNKTEDE